MSRIKKWFVGAWMTVASALGIQYVRPPIIEHIDPPVVTSTPTPSATPVLPVSSYPQITEGKIVNATDFESALIKESIRRDQAVLASDCAKTEVLSSTYTTTTDTPEMIWTKLLKNPKQINVTMFYGSWLQNYGYKTVGIDKGDGIVYANRFYVKDADTLGSLNLHEGEGHGQGYTHESALDSSSQPYTMNRVYEKCAKVLGL